METATRGSKNRLKTATQLKSTTATLAPTVAKRTNRKTRSRFNKSVMFTARAHSRNLWAAQITVTRLVKTRVEWFSVKPSGSKGLFVVIAFWAFGCERRKPLLRVAAHGAAVNQYCWHHIVLGDCTLCVWGNGEPDIPLEMDLAAGSRHMRSDRVGRNCPVSRALEFFLSG